MPQRISIIILNFVFLITVSFASYAQNKFEGVVQYKASMSSKNPEWSVAQLKQTFLETDSSTQYYSRAGLKRTDAKATLYYRFGDEKVYYQFAGVDTLYTYDSKQSANSDIALDFPGRQLMILGRACSAIRMEDRNSTKTYYYPATLELEKNYDPKNKDAFMVYLEQLTHPFLKQVVESHIAIVEHTATSILEKTLHDSITQPPALPVRDIKTQKVYVGPEFRQAKFMNFIHSNINTKVSQKYMKIPKGQTEVRQTVYVSFTVTASGAVANPFVVNPKEVHPKLAEESVRVVSESPAWTPAKYMGKSIPYQMLLPIVYVLAE